MSALPGTDISHCSDLPVGDCVEREAGTFPPLAPKGWQGDAKLCRLLLNLCRFRQIRNASRLDNRCVEYSLLAEELPVVHMAHRASRTGW